MANKTKKPAKMANRNVGAVSTIKDDGEKYHVVDGADCLVYRGEGLVLAEAVRLSTTLVQPAAVVKVEEDGSLTHGNVINGEFVAAVSETDDAAQAAELVAA